MTTPHDPFEAGQREALRSTDALLDRLGARTPTPGDLDDPVVAALALMAAEIDLDAVAVDATRVAAERAFPDVTPGIGRTLSAPAAPAPGGAGSGLVIDLRDYPGYSHAREALRRRLSAAEEPTGTTQGARWLPLPRPFRRRPAHATTPTVRPWSLRPAAHPGAAAHPGTAAHPGAPEHLRGAGRPAGRRDRRLRPMTAIVVAIAAIILGSGASAAVTGGRSVNPLTGLQQVVAQVMGGRTGEQSTTYDRAVRLLQEARGAAAKGDRVTTVTKLNRISTEGLSPEDVSAIEAQKKQVLSVLDGR